MNICITPRRATYPFPTLEEMATSVSSGGRRSRVLKLARLRGRTVLMAVRVPLMKGRLTGKGAVVTGASSGIGEASAVAMCREGAKIAVVARRMAEGEDVASRARAAGADCGGDAVFI